MLLPVALRLEGRACLVVGGGKVAAKKCDSLLACDARVTVIAPQLRGDLQKFSDQVEHRARFFLSNDCEGFDLVFACTNDEAVNRQIANEAERLHLWCNLASDARQSTLHIAAAVRREDICIGITTGGGSPALARHIKKQVEDCVGDEYGILLSWMSAQREELKNRYQHQEERARIWHEVLGSEVLTLLRQGHQEQAAKLFEKIVCS